MFSVATSGCAMYPIPALGVCRGTQCSVRHYPGSSTSSCHSHKLTLCHSWSAPTDSQALPQWQNYIFSTVLRNPGVCIGAHQCWPSLRRADCSCSAFTAQGSLLLLQWEGKEGHRAAEALRVVSSEKMPGTEAQATRSPKEASCTPRGSSKPRSLT